MKMRETSWAVDKKLLGNNNLLGKSFLTAVYCCCRCILYPNTKIIVASGTKGQARLLISQKIEKELMGMSPNLRREIAYVKVGANDALVKFKNGSTIEAVASGESARGFRCNILILDECRLISQHVLNSINICNWVFERCVAILFSWRCYHGKWLLRKWKTVCNR